MYCGVFESRFTINPEVGAAARESVIKTFGKDEIWGYATGAVLSDYDNLGDLLEGYHFDVTRDGEGIVSIFDGCLDPCVAEQLFATLAPFVSDGSYLVWQGECLGDLFAYTFDQGKMTVRKVAVDILF